MKCYESTNEKFKCAIQKLKCEYADQVYSIYLEKRYGIKTCDKKIELGDLHELMSYIATMPISVFDENTYRNEIITNDLIVESISDNCIPSFYKETLNVCNISVLLEKINSL